MKTLFVLALLLTVCSTAFAGYGIADESDDPNSYGHGIAPDDASSNNQRAWNEF